MCVRHISHPLTHTCTFVYSTQKLLDPRRDLYTNAPILNIHDSFKSLLLFLDHLDYRVVPKASVLIKPPLQCSGKWKVLKSIILKHTLQTENMF